MDRTAELEQIRSELDAFEGREDLTPEEVARGNELLDREERILGEVAERDAFEARRAAGQERLASALEANRTTTEAAVRRAPVAGVHRDSNPWDLDGVYRASAGELASRAQDAIERMSDVDDSRRQSMAVIAERAEGNPAQLLLATTSPSYRSAFGKLLLNEGRLDRLNDTERQAIEATEPLRRAMSAGTNNTGGFLVPTDIEPSVTLSSDGTNNPVYNLARKVQTTGTTYRVVQAPNAAWSWDGENTEVSDDTPTFANTDITLHVAQGFVPVSFAAQQSIGGAMSVASDALMGGWNDLIGAALTTGSGSSQPFGIVTALAASAGGASLVTPGTAETFAVGDVYKVHESLPSRHRRNASWLAHIATIADIRQFADDDGHALLARLGDGEPPRLLGRPLFENEDMDDSSTINAAATAANYILIEGDFQHYVIAEGWGSMVRIIPDVFGGNGRPLGASGVYMSTRLGADSVLDGAFRMLNVATTA